MKLVLKGSTESLNLYFHIFCLVLGLAQRCVIQSDT